MYACSRQLILYPFSKIIEVLSFLGSQRFTHVDPWPGLQHETWVSPMNQDLTTIGKQLVTPIMFMPLLYLWAYFAWPISAVDYKFVIQQSAQHLLVLWKLTRKALSSKLPYSTSLYSTSSVTKLSGIFSNRPYSHRFFWGEGQPKSKTMTVAFIVLKVSGTDWRGGDSHLALGIFIWQPMAFGRIIIPHRM